MRTALRRLGILCFAALSFFSGFYAASPAAGGIPSGLRFMLTGAALACLALLLVGELSNWLARLPESTRRETMLAELVVVESCVARAPVNGDEWMGQSRDVDEHGWESMEDRQWVDESENEAAEAVRRW